jgi:hypothetical protein
MSEPFVEPLSRFTPDAGGLDRATLLLAVGRASARPNRGWIALAAALAITQALTLALLWPQPAPPAAQLPPPAVAPAVPPQELEPSTPYPPESNGMLSAYHQLLDSDPEARPAPAGGGPFIDSGPPLRAVAPPPPSLLN